MAKTAKDMDSKVVFESPVANLKGGWLELVKTQYLNCGNAILQEGDGNSEKFHYSFLFLLNLLPGGVTGKKRHVVYEIYKKLLKERFKGLEGGDISNKEKARIRQEIELEMVGHITDYIDKYIGIQEKLTVDFVGVMSDEMREANKGEE